MRGLEIDLPTRVRHAHEAIIRGWAQNAIPGQRLSLFLGDPRLATGAVSPSIRYLEEHTAELKARELEPGVLVIQAADKDAERLIEAAEARLRETEKSTGQIPVAKFLPSWAVFPELAEAA